MVKFKTLPTGQEHLDIIQQNVTDAVEALQSATQASSGISQVSGNYTLQPTDKHLLVTANSDTVIALGPGNVQHVSVIVNNGPKACNVRSADGKTNFGKVPVGGSITVLATGKGYQKI